MKHIDTDPLSSHSAEDLRSVAQFPSSILAKNKDILRERHVLDIGAGTGRNSIYLKRFLGCTVTACDIEYLHDQNKYSSAVSAMQADGIVVQAADVGQSAWWERQTDSYEAMVAIFSLRFAAQNSQEYAELIRRMIGVSKPHGAHIIHDFLADPKVSHIATEYWPENVREVTNYYKAAGWKNIQTETTIMPSYVHLDASSKPLDLPAFTVIAQA